jgi:glyoxylase-like metal-dependent hydrolase (beta-lactamase superfamily II)
VRSSFYLSVLVARLLLGSAAAVSAQSGPQVPVTVRRLSERVAVFDLAGPQATHITAFRSARGVVVVDTEVSPVFARVIRARIEAEFAAPVAWVILTHGHGDHAFGNQAFAEVPIIAHRNACQDLIEAEGRREQTVTGLRRAVTALQGRLAGLAPEDPARPALAGQIAYYQGVAEGLGESFRLTLPTVLFDDRLTLELEDLTLQLIWYGIGHSRGDLLVWCPQEGVLVTGDEIIPGQEPYLDSERIPSLPRWAAVLEEVLADPAAIRHIIPGHDASPTVADLQATLDFARAQQARFAGRESARNVFERLYQEAGAESALARLRAMAADSTRYYTLHPELDQFAYRMMMQGKSDEARPIFGVLTELFPETWMAWDSLGEVCLRKEDRTGAIAAFEKSLALNPDNENAVQRLRELKKG